MRYWQLKINTAREIFESVTTALETAGFDEMIIDDPQDLLEIEEHPEWYRYDYINEELADKAGNDPLITLYFNDDEEGWANAQKAGEIAESKGSDCVIERTGDDSEWLYKWQEHFKTTRVGDRIVVKPSWEDYDAKPGELVIEMDPGMAFGSGLHETTTLCVRALEEALQSSDDRRAASIGGAKLLDIGCGTGILSIAAALLGADECLAVDIDADAVRIARDNIERNHLSDRIKAVAGDLAERISYEPDIIVANLMSDLVIRLAPDAARQLAGGGIFISSGILDVKVEAVAEAVRDAGFEIKEILSDGEWRAIVAAFY